MLGFQQKTLILGAKVGQCHNNEHSVSNTVGIKVTVCGIACDYIRKANNESDGPASRDLQLIIDGILGTQLIHDSRSEDVGCTITSTVSWHGNYAFMFADCPRCDGRSLHMNHSIGQAMLKNWTASNSRGTLLPSYTLDGNSSC